jgi:hypothetical protein
MYKTDIFHNSSPETCRCDFYGLTDAQVLDQLQTPPCIYSLAYSLYLLELFSDEVCPMRDILFSLIQQDCNHNVSFCIAWHGPILGISSQ